MMGTACGEEGGFLNGARWLVDNQRDLIDAEFALNEGGYGETDAAGNRTNQNIQAAQKVVMGFTFATTNPADSPSRVRASRFPKMEISTYRKSTRSP